MRILGVDPGTLVAGYGCLDLQGVSWGGVAEARSQPPVSLRQTDGDAHPIAHPIAHRVANLARVGSGKLSVVDAGALRLGRSKDPIPGRLRSLADEIRRLLAELRPDELAIEEAFFGRSVQSALRIGESRGVVLAEADRAGVAVSQFPPARIKRSVTGNGAASKEQVARMVVQVLRLNSRPETTDVTDALAVGLCCVEARRSFRGGSR